MFIQKFLMLFALFLGVARFVTCVRTPCRPEMEKTCKEICAVPRMTCRAEKSRRDCYLGLDEEQCSEESKKTCSAFQEMYRCEDRFTVCDCKVLNKVGPSLYSKCYIVPEQDTSKCPK